MLHELYAKKEKCCFGSQQIQHLGHVISREGINVDKDTITTILNWPIPKSVKDNRVKFIKNYGSIAAPLSDLVKKDLYLWDQLALNAFNNLKEALTTVPVLVLPDFTIPFVVECDTSGIGLGIILLQQGHLVVFTARFYMAKICCCQHMKER